MKDLVLLHLPSIFVLATVSLWTISTEDKQKALSGFRRYKSDADEQERKADRKQKKERGKKMNDLQKALEEMEVYELLGQPAPFPYDRLTGEKKK